MMVWPTVTDLPEGKLAGQVILALQGPPKAFALHYAESLLVAENSLKKLLDLLDSEYYPPCGRRGGRKYRRFLRDPAV